MPIWKFPTASEADTASIATPPGEVALRTSLVLATLDEATRRGVRISQLGVHKYSTVAAGESERERYALTRLRAADRRPDNPPPSDE